MTRVRRPTARNFNPPQLCGGKYCYDTRQQAELVIEEKSITDPDITLTCYHCPGNNHWHLTRIRQQTDGDDEYHYAGK